MKKKSDCGFRFKANDILFCADETGVTERYLDEFYACKITKEKCIGLKVCPIRNK